MSSLDPELAPLEIEHEHIVQATNNFAEENLLKRGEKADAYKGWLSCSNVQIHIVIWKYTGTLTFDFYEEIKKISCLKHRNSVSFVGFSKKESDRLIVMEHVVGRYLPKYTSGPTFKWSQRFNTYFDAALVLNKVHDDIRSCKILLDTEDSDVYSFGLILLEMLYGRKPTPEDVKQYLAKNRFEEEKQLDDIVPPDVRTQIHTKSLLICSEIANMCLKKQADQQSPYMFKQIVRRLKEAFDIQWMQENYDWVKELEPLKIPLALIVSATFKFSTAYSITSNKHERVYRAMRGHLGNVLNEEVIIKRIFSQEKPLKDFYIEIKRLTNCSHPNLPTFLGFSDEDSELILVFECGFKETLNEYLRSKSKRANLTWERRIRISLDIAFGFKYLRDVKAKPSMILSANVFLDEEYTAIIVDFRLSESNSSSGERLVTDDIYFLGVILFEILTGKLAYDPLYFTENVNGFASKKRRHFDEGTLEIDPRIAEETIEFGSFIQKEPNQNSINTFSKIAYQCLAETPSERPTLESVINSLREALHFQMESMKHRLKIAFEDINKATEGFNKNCHIGYGGYGNVYKAELNIRSKYTPAETPCTVAIKRIKRRGGGEGKTGFDAEINVLSKREHRNIVSLQGYCEKGDEMLLVYEYAAKGSLDRYLMEGIYNLKWAQRLKMCIDIAHGLEYLHIPREVKEKVIHRDIKSGNILLGENWEAMVADFGLSKVLDENQVGSTINTEHAAGTELYKDPEYIKTGRLKRASDIYSLGVVLCEIFTGKLASNSRWKKKLAPIAREHIKKGTFEQILDENMKDESDELKSTLKLGPDQESLKVFSELVYLCLTETQKGRPNIVQVIKKLRMALKLQQNRKDTFKMSFDVIRSGTGNFNKKNLIIKCNDWRLYRGEVQYNNGLKKVVVKRFSSSDQEDRFKNECEVLLKYKQKNIINFVGYCKEEANIIVYEDASNGCLSSYLNVSTLSWSTRLKICIDIANGLKFLHEGNAGKDVLIHRDIKSCKILLTNDWNAKICGFEFALTRSTDKEQDPLYLETKNLTTESDVYSLGMILFELLCGRSLAGPDDKTDHIPFLNVLDKSHKEAAQLKKIVFEGIKKHIVGKSFDIFRTIVLKCLHEKREEQPTATDVIKQLEEALKFQLGYDERKTKLDKIYQETLDEYSRSPKIYSTIQKKDMRYILSKGILLENDKLLIEQIVWDAGHYSLPFVGEDDEDYHSDPETSPIMKRKYSERVRRWSPMSRVSPNEEPTTSSSTFLDPNLIVTPDKETVIPSSTFLDLNTILDGLAFSYEMPQTKDPNQLMADM